MANNDGLSLTRIVNESEMFVHDVWNEWKSFEPPAFFRLHRLFRVFEWESGEIDSKVL